MEDIKIGPIGTPCEVEIKKNVFKNTSICKLSRAPLVILIPGFYNK